MSLIFHLKLVNLNKFLSLNFDTINYLFVDFYKLYIKCTRSLV